MEFILASIAGFFAAGVAYLRHASRKEARLAAKPTHLAVLSLADADTNGYGVYRGSVVPGDAVLTGPFSGRRCVYWRVILEKWTTFPEGRNSTIPDLEEVAVYDARADFVLADASGRAIVSVAGASFRLAANHEGPPDKDALAALLESRGERRWQPGALRARETVLEVGASCYAMGYAHRDEDARPTSPNIYREPATKLILDTREGQALVIRSDVG